MMKHFTGFLLSALLFVGFSPFSEIATDEVVELQALELSDDLAQVLREYRFLEVYEIDKENILRPLSNQHLVYVQETRKYLIAETISEQSIEETTNNYEVIELGGGTKAHCYCEQGNDDCEFQPTSENGPGRDDFKCDGSCGCGIAITIGATKEIARVETASGDWISSRDLNKY